MEHNTQIEYVKNYTKVSKYNKKLTAHNNNLQLIALLERYDL